MGRALPRARARASRCSRRSSPASCARRLPAAPPDARRAVRARAARPRRACSCPALTHWQSPRFFAYFATTGSEPGILAELLIAGLNQVGILWRTSPALQELEEVTLDWLAQLLGLPAGLHGHIEDTASTGDAGGARGRAAAKPGARVVVCSEHAHSVGRQGLPAARARGPDDARRRRVPRCGRTRSTSTDACAVVATVGTTSTTLGRPRRRDRRHAASARASGCTSTPPTPARPRSARSFATTSTAGSAPTRSSSTRTSGCSRRWTAPRSGRGGPTTCARAFSLVPEYLRVSEEVVSLSEYSPALGRRFRALKLWAVLRCYGREGLQERIREAVRLAALFEGWVRDEPGWELARAAAVLARLLPPRRLGRGERGAARARQRLRRDLPLAHEAQRPLRAAARRRQRTHDRGRRAAGLGRPQTGSGAGVGANAVDHALERRRVALDPHAVELPVHDEL